MAPVREALDLIREVRPGARRLGTLWTPSELNSAYYLDLVGASAAELGFEVEAVAVESPSDVLLAAQVLVNRKVDVIFPISDNTINTSFEALAKVADENRLPLFGGFLLAANAGAAAAVGWDFFDMGYRSGQIALRVRNGESPARIPFQSMSGVRLALNLRAAERQGVTFPPEVLRRATGILKSDAPRPASLD
jgi:putative ABC transport system substrate-binding protein